MTEKKSAKKKRHILFVAPNRMRGGSVILRYTAQHLMRQGHRVSVLIPQEGPIAQILRDMGTSVWICNLPGWRIFFLKPLNWWLCWRLARRIRAEKVDIVDINQYKLAPHGICAARWAGVPSVVYIHDNIPVSKAKKYLLHQATALICVSDFDAKPLRQMPNPVYVIYPGTDVDKFNPNQASTITEEFYLEKQHFVVVITGEVIRTKGYLELFEAAEQLIKMIPDIRFIVLGGYAGTDLCDGADALQAMLKQRGIDEHVIMAGFRKDVVQFLARADLFLMPSHLEMFPSAILEAMAMRVPIIATTVGGIPEMVQHQAQGLLIPPRSSQAIVDAVKQMYENEPLRDQYQQAAFVRVHERFSIWVKTREKEALYEACLGEPTPDMPTLSNKREQAAFLQTA